MAGRLTKSSGERVVFGVLGGLAEYFEFDPVLVRVAFALAVLLTGVGGGLLVYVVLAMVMPDQASLTPDARGVVRENVARMPGEVARAGGRFREAFVRGSGAHRERYVAGAVLVVVGALLLAANFGWLGWFGWWRLWPALVIAVGVVLLVARGGARE